MKHVFAFTYFFFTSRENKPLLLFFPLLENVPKKTQVSREIKDVTFVLRRIYTLVSKSIDKKQTVSHDLILSQHWTQNNVILPISSVCI